MIKEYKVTKPNKALNSDLFYKETGFNLFEKEDGLYISGEELTQSQADALLIAHNPPARLEATIEDKLASVGLSVTDLKTALGL